MVVISSTKIIKYFPFLNAFNVDDNSLGSDLIYNAIPEWDSIGHMALIADLEDTFEISLEMDDIIDFSSYEKGIEIMKKYDVDI